MPIRLTYRQLHDVEFGGPEQVSGFSRNDVDSNRATARSLCIERSLTEGEFHIVCHAEVRRTCFGALRTIREYTTDGFTFDGWQASHRASDDGDRAQRWSHSHRGLRRDSSFFAVIPYAPSRSLLPKTLSKPRCLANQRPRAAFFDTGFVRKPTAPASTLTRGTLKCTVNGALRTLARPSLSRGKAATGSIASPTSSPLSSRTKKDTCSQSNSFSDAIDKARVCPMFAQIPPKPVGTGDFECTVLLVSPKVIVVTGVPAILDAAPSTDTSMRCKKTYDSAPEPELQRGGRTGAHPWRGTVSSLFGIDLEHSDHGYRTHHRAASCC